MHRLRLKSSGEWNEYCKSDLKSQRNCVRPTIEIHKGRKILEICIMKNTFPHY